MKSPPWFTKIATGFSELATASRKAAAATIRRLPFGTAGFGRFFNGLFGWLPGSNYDYEREAGDLSKNSLVSICLNWIADNFPEAPFCVRKLNENGKLVIDPLHPLTALIARPNPYYGADLLWGGTLASLDLDGNAYWWKNRNALDEVVELWWIPHTMIEPAWPPDGSEWISHYEYSVNARKVPIPRRDIVHLRSGSIDTRPGCDRKFVSRLKAQLREICTDNEGATFSSATLRNMGVPGVVISPESVSKAPDGQVKPMKKETREKFRDTWGDKFGGDRRGEPLVLDQPMRIDKVSLSPKDLDVGALRRIPESRVAAAFGIPPIVLSFMVGLEHATFANYKEAREAAIESCLIPRQRRIGVQLDLQLLPDFDGDPFARCGFDVSEVRALQDDMNKLFERAESACGGPFITPNEARGLTGYKPILKAQSQDTADEYDQIRAPRPAPQLPMPGATQTTGDDTTKKPANTGAKP